MNPRDFVVFALLFAVIALLGYKWFVKRADIDTSIPRSARVRIYVLVLGALLLALSFYYFLTYQNTDFPIVSDFSKLLLALLAAIFLMVLIAILLPYDENRGRLIAVFIAGLVPISFYLLFRNLLPISMLLWVLLVVTIGTIAFTLSIFLKNMR